MFGRGLGIRFTLGFHSLCCSNSHMDILGYLIYKKTLNNFNKEIELRGVKKC
jgi:hypothetical protein